MKDGGFRATGLVDADEGRVTMEEAQSVIGYDSMQYLARPVVQVSYPRER